MGKDYTQGRKYRQGGDTSRGNKAGREYRQGRNTGREGIQAGRGFRLGGIQEGEETQAGE